MAVGVQVVPSMPDSATVVGVPVYEDGAVPDRQAHDRATLAASGFGATVGETLVLPRVEGPTHVEVGLGPHMRSSRKLSCEMPRRRSRGQPSDTARWSSMRQQSANSRRRPSGKPSSRACSSPAVAIAASSTSPWRNT